MAYFSNEFNTFFKGLAAHNNKEWMDEHRKTYHKEVKDPFYQLVEDLISEIGQFQNLDLEVKNAVFRINNDIRFNKEKPLYKLHVGASIVNGGRKNFNDPGFYIHLSPGESFIVSGVYKPDKEQLLKIRHKIAKHLEEFQNLKEDQNFKKWYPRFGDSETHKIIPKELKPAAEKEPMIYNKQFYYIHDFPEGEELVLREDLLDFIMKHYQAGKPMNDFLSV